MERIDNHLKYNQLRELYPTFFYDGFDYQIENNRCVIHYYFHVGDIFFQPTMILDCGNYWCNDLNERYLNGLLFHIGLIEMVSYWKATCSPTIFIKPFLLNEMQQNWWKKLYYKGLGEFFYHNQIQPCPDDFCRFVFDERAQSLSPSDYFPVPENNAVIIPIGGGKDSVVTLERMNSDYKKVPFIINPRGATLATARVAGFHTSDDLVILDRQIDSKLLELNKLGFLNGHTPFSAMLAFYTLLVSFCTRTRRIALSNENSASEPTIPGTEINHQYSKSLEFEIDFRNYVSQFMNDCGYYYSFLRPYSEYEIASMFAQYPQYHDVFRSCNAGSKQDIWCCNCSKCLFAYLILSPFIDDEKMIHIFGEDLLNKKSMEHYFDELTGIAENKPFECVGTVDEVNKAVREIIPTRKDKYLIQHYLTVNKL